MKHNISVQKQEWVDCTRYLFSTEGASVQLEIYPKPTQDGIRAYICRLWVDERYRRQGRAKALLDAAEAMARREGMATVSLAWNENDTPVWMLEYYRRRGYEDFEFGENYVLLKRALK